MPGIHTESSVQERTGVRLGVANTTPVPRRDDRGGVPHTGRLQKLPKIDAQCHWGGGMGNVGAVESMPVVFHSRPHSLSLTLLPLSILYFNLTG